MATDHIIRILREFDIKYAIGDGDIIYCDYADLKRSTNLGYYYRGENMRSMRTAFQWSRRMIPLCEGIEIMEKEGNGPCFPLLFRLCPESAISTFAEQTNRGWVFVRRNESISFYHRDKSAGGSYRYSRLLCGLVHQVLHKPRDRVPIPDPNGKKWKWIKRNSEKIFATMDRLDADLGREFLTTRAIDQIRDLFGPILS